MFEAIFILETKEKRKKERKRTTGLSEKGKGPGKYGDLNLSLSNNIINNIGNIDLNDIIVVNKARGRMLREKNYTERKLNLISISVCACVFFTSSRYYDWGEFGLTLHNVLRAKVSQTQTISRMFEFKIN